MQLRPTHDFQFETSIKEICDLNWSSLTEGQLRTVAWSYYFFSIQFRENLLIARNLFPEDLKLKELESGECNTDNLSPFPGVAHSGEQLDHDEFMRRLLCLEPTSDEERLLFMEAGQQYLSKIAGVHPVARAMSIASYEDGGLLSVFNSILQAPALKSDLLLNPLLRAFRYFLAEHVALDSDPELGHGALSRQLAPDDSILPIWNAFKELFVQFTPALLFKSTCTAADAAFVDRANVGSTAVHDFAFVTIYNPVRAVLSVEPAS